MATTRFVRADWIRLADWMAVAVAVTLPWSTSATSIAVGVWLVVLVPALDGHSLRRELGHAAGLLPVVFVALGVLGMAWAEVTVAERVHGVTSFLRLLAIPLLFVHCRLSERTHWPFVGFLVSCTILLAASLAMVFAPPSLQSFGKTPGVPVKDYIAQSAEFTLAAFGAGYVALRSCHAHRYGNAALLFVLALAFMANIFYVTTSRTTLVTIPVLLGLFVLTQFSGKIRAAMVLFGIGVVVAGLTIAPVAHQSLTKLGNEIEAYRASGSRTSAGERLDYWLKAVAIIRDAPLIGHGTGSIKEKYRHAAEGKTGVGSDIPDNPHNQILTVAIQLGLVGAALLLAMWAAHFLLFLRSTGLAAFVGLMIVAQNIVGSLFNSYLFDFTHGWLYVFGVGIAGGAVLARANDRARDQLD
jgi:O-antigen ligase